MLKDTQDAFGHAMKDNLTKRRGSEIIERDDGLFEATGGPSGYFSTYEDWPDHQKRALESAKGRVLDVGCGAGRHALYLQEQVLDVVGIDNSPLAIEVCKERGLRSARVLSITQITAGLGAFDTILMLGNNFGLFGGLKRARWLLGRFYKMTSREGTIIAESTDPYMTEAPEHLEYHQLNRAKGRMGGQLRMRARSRKFVTPWFDYLLASKEEVSQIVEGTGWQVSSFVDGHNGRYIAIISKGSR